MDQLAVTEVLRDRLEKLLNNLISKIGRIQIGNNHQFPYGWRRAGKGRTVWRILEEAITQNLEKYREELGILKIYESDSEVSVFDCKFSFESGIPDVYINVKSAVLGGRTNKDDISKADGLIKFFGEESDRQLFIATFVIRFDDDMHIALTSAHVLPIAWLPDVYVNPSNNGNLQSSKYKDLSTAVRRTNEQFIAVLTEEMAVAATKRKLKRPS